MSDYSPFVNRFIQRAQEKEEQRQALFNTLNKKVKEAALIIGEKYQVQGVYLFGSLTNFDSFHLASDIDLAVEGIASSEYLNLWGDLEDLLDHPFDLVQLEKASPGLAKKIREEGEKIYECPQKRK